MVNSFSNIDLRMKIALFDFDGTITRNDSFIRFGQFVRGNVGFARAIIQALPWLIAWKLNLCSNTKAKKQLFKYLFKGMDYADFREYCKLFVDVINTDLRNETIELLRWHKNEGHLVAIVSASIGDWIRPWAATYDIDCVLATEIDIMPNGKISGNFASANCHGEEKVRRFTDYFQPNPEDEIWTYGDSAGDDAMLEMATHPYRL